MDDSALDDMLRAAGRAELPLGAMPTDLAGRVRRLRVRRRRTRRTVAALSAAAVLLLAIVGMEYYARQPGRVVERPIAKRAVAQEPTPQRPAVDVEQLRAEIASLSAEADARQEIVGELMAQWRHREQIARLDEQLDLPDLSDDARAETEKAAFLLVDCAEQRLATWPERVAADEYRRILEHFPNTDAADVARTRLGELTNHEGAL